MTDREIKLLKESRQFIAGKTWLVIQLMQGSTLTCHHSSRSHYAQINGKTVTDVHATEAGLVGELGEHHNFTFGGLKCMSSIGDMNYLKTEWKWLAT